MSKITAMDETADIYELIDKMRDVQALNDTSVAEDHVFKKIDYESIFLVGYGDLHIENLGTDLERIETELKIMSNIPNLYVVFMGDLTDSSVKYLNNNFDTYLTPKAAREFGYRIFDALGDKLICALSGCHEKHSEEVADFDYVEEYCKKRSIPFLNERGLLTLVLQNGRTINIAVAHKAQGYSMYNPFHPAIRIVREKYPEADVVITAHQHQSGIAIQTEQDKQRAMMTIGSRKQNDRYATRRGFFAQLSNKNLPALEVLPGGYKILNDITLLGNYEAEERHLKLGEQLLTHVATERPENEKLETLKAMGFENAVPVKDSIKAEAKEEEIRLRRIMAEDSTVLPQQRSIERVAAHFRKKEKDEAQSIEEAREEAERIRLETYALARNQEIKENIEKDREREAAKQAEEHPPIDEETEKAERRKKDRERKRAYVATNRKEYNKYMQKYMQKYRERKKEEEDIK